MSSIKSSARCRGGNITHTMHFFARNHELGIVKTVREKWSFLVVLFSSFIGTSVSAAITSIDTGLINTAKRAGLNDTATVPQYVGGIISAILGVIGVIFRILIVYGGMLWMLAEGDETKVGKARGFIFHAIVGLIIVFSAYAITNFVVGTLITQSIQ